MPEFWIEDPEFCWMECGRETSHVDIEGFTWCAECWGKFGGGSDG